VPQRTCVVCRTTTAKRGLVRIVRTADGVRIDPTGKLSGRGAYLCLEAACWSAPGLRARLDTALKTTMSDEDFAALRAYAATLASA
jgi:predicted RNA-binding protein YlxR (DUF448 family)